MTQIEFAKKGKTTPEMRRVAQDEGVDIDFIRKGLIDGSIEVGGEGALSAANIVLWIGCPFAIGLVSSFDAGIVIGDLPGDNIQDILRSLLDQHDIFDPVSAVPTGCGA